ncbi:MAG: lipopolysaccharide heptosyltransferase II [Deltaproteobacteria bacterium]|nr:lipopolysaccharide heptosyltransferase II [Deltaproteobacteria bacterium]MBW2351625.1 lipopolysaccharide heptosyltransferase II [Deltaproteobacteria bacterium]
MDKKGIRRILIRSTNWVGDAVMTLPALEAVRDNFPQARITVLGKPWVAPIFSAHPAVDSVLPFNKGEGAFTGFREVARVIRLIRRQRFDLAILFQNAFEAALLCFMGGVRFRVGYATDARGFLLTHSIEPERKVLKLHQSEYYLSILRAMGWEAKSRDPVLHLSSKDRDSAGAVLEREGIGKDEVVVGLGPGAIFGGAKRWPPARFARLGDRAVEEWGARVLILGSGREEDLCGAVCSSMAHDSLNLCGRTSLNVAMGLISRCRIFVTNDSGLMHVACALRVPTVAIFGPTDHVATGPRGPGAVVVRHDTECAPCLKQECPVDHRCMLAIGWEEVWEKITGLWRDDL